MPQRISATLVATAAVLLAVAPGAGAAPVAASGYNVSVFAGSPAGTSGADSVEVVGGNVYVGYSNGTPKDGSGGTSTIIEYSPTGSVLNSTTVPGHTDGLRYDPGSGKIWSMQNEDANPNLVLITPGTMAKSPVMSFSAVPHGGGYDDAVFTNGKAYVTASNPMSDPNTAPALSSVTLAGVVATVTGVLNGNAAATPLNAGAPNPLNLQDPDSLSLTRDGRIVLTSQADGVLVFVSNVGTPSQSVASLLLPTGVQVDDTTFADSASHHTLLVADKSTNIVYALDGTFGYNVGYSAAVDGTNAGFVGLLNQSTGSLTPVITGLGNPGGEAFLDVPEPASITLLAVGFAGLVRLRRRD